MSHQRYPSVDPVKEPHSVSLKVLRLSRPSLVTQQPLVNPISSLLGRAQTVPGSLAYRSKNSNTNPDPFLLTPILNLPPSFGSAYVGETFSCTLCANYEIQPDAGALSASSTLQAQGAELPPAQKKKWIRDVRIEAEMKTPGSGITQKLVLGPTSMPTQSEGDEDESKSGADLEPGRTLQRIVNFDLKEEGNHVLAVTVSYYEATETSGRTRTFRKLYQFICKGSLIVRTKVGVLPSASSRRKQNENRESHIEPPSEKTLREETSRKWVLEAQLENCSEDVMQLDHVKLNLEAGSRLRYRDANWTISGSAKPVLHPGEVEQVCFVVEELGREGAETDEDDTKVVFGVLGIGWRTEMGNRGFLSTGKLGTKTNTTTSR